MSTQGRPSGYDLIDRDPQNLPMPVGGFDVFHKRRRPSQLRRWLRTNVPPTMIALGILAAAFGAYLTVMQPPTPVYLLDGQIHIAGNVMTLASETGGMSTTGGTSTTYKGTFTGNGALVLVEDPDGTASAGGSTEVDGGIVTGSCHMSTKSNIITDHCTFSLTGTPLSSVDTYDLSRSGDHNWHRIYSDGRTTLISVPTDGALIPVPFPVGR